MRKLKSVRRFWITGVNLSFDGSTYDLADTYPFLMFVLALFLRRKLRVF